MQHPLLILILGGLSPAAWGACEGRVTGHVTDIDTDTPIPGSRVEVGELWVLTSDDGRFVIDKACDGPAELHVHHPEYQTATQSITVPAEHLDLALIPDFDTVIVHAKGESHGAKATSELTGAALERTRGEDLSEALEGVVGVTLLRTSGDASRPMVRGQYGRRLLLLNDGIRHESQKWGAEHAPELDPLAAGRIEVVRGPAGVRYGPDAVGGVVLMTPEPLREAAGVGGRLDWIAASNGQQGTAGASLDLANGDGAAMRLQGNLSNSGDRRAPDYVLGNTASRTANAALTAAWERPGFTLSAGVRHHAFDAGICACVRASSPEELLASLEADRPPGADDWTAGRGIDQPRQRVRHTLAFMRTEADLSFGTVELTANLQINERKEFETARQAIDTPQYDFTLRTTTVDAGWLHRSAHLGDLATLRGRVGATAVLQDNVFVGLPLVPNHRAASAGAFVSESLAIGHSRIDAGVRIDRQVRTTFLTDTAHARLTARDALGATDCEPLGAAFRCPQSWTGGAVTLGGVWHDTRERIELRIDGSSAARFPDGDELFQDGAAPSQPIFAHGDPSLDRETTWGLTPTVVLDLAGFHGEISAFGSWVNDAITFRPVRGADGAPVVDTTVRGAFPRYAFVQQDTWMGGLEAHLLADLHPWISTEFSALLIRGAVRESGAPLPFLPPDRARLAVLVTPQLDAVRGASVGLTVEAVDRQRRWDADTDLGPPPPGVVLLGASADAPIPLDGAELRLGVVVDNLMTHARAPTRACFVTSPMTLDGICARAPP